MNPHHDIATLRKVALWLGLTALIVAAVMSFLYGLSMSFSHAICLGLLTLAGSIIFPYAGHLQSAGSRKSALFFTVGALFLAVEFFSHVGYSVGQRVMNAEETGVQNANYKIAQDSVGDEKQLIASMRDRLAKMQDENAWAATVSAEGLRAQIAPMELAISQETARGGCGPKCLKLTQDKAALQDKIAVVEKVDDLTAQIAATQRVLDKKSEKATTTEFKTSAVVAQTNFVAQIATLSLDPDRAAMTWVQIFIGLMIATVTTFLAPTLIAMALGPIEYVPGASKAFAKATEKATEKATDANAAILREMQAMMAKFQPAASSAPAQPIHLTETYNVTDDKRIREIQARCLAEADRIERKAA
jgi:hypothetical protein